MASGLGSLEPRGPAVQSPGEFTLNLTKEGTTTEIRKQEKPNSTRFKLSPRRDCASRHPGQASPPGLGARSRPCRVRVTLRAEGPLLPYRGRTSESPWAGRALRPARAHSRSL